MPLKLMVTREVSPTEIYNLVLGTGALSMPWWSSATFMNDGAEVESEEGMTEQTTLHLRGMSAEEKPVIFALTMQEVVNAAGVVMARGHIHEESLTDMQSEDLGFADAGDADLILQQAVHGEIIFG